MPPRHTLLYSISNSPTSSGKPQDMHFLTCSNNKSGSPDASKHDAKSMSPAQPEKQSKWAWKDFVGRPHSFFEDPGSSTTFILLLKHVSFSSCYDLCFRFFPWVDNDLISQSIIFRKMQLMRTCDSFCRFYCSCISCDIFFRGAGGQEQKIIITARLTQSNQSIIDHVCANCIVTSFFNP